MTVPVGPIAQILGAALQGGLQIAGAATATPAAPGTPPAGTPATAPAQGQAPAGQPDPTAAAAIDAARAGPGK